LNFKQVSLGTKDMYILHYTHTGLYALLEFENLFHIVSKGKSQTKLRILYKDPNLNLIFL